ncbi:MAG: ATP-binding protein [Oculatellaceae cyanobacterium bins.114]|nr:ATP-binding protein [Oculatellaceae cyanobacterium bins.114]
MLRSQHSHSQPSTVPWINLVPKLISGGVIAISSLVLIGWIFDINTLKSILPYWVSMKVNSAIAFLSAGIALGLIQRQIRQPRLTPRLTKVGAIAQVCAGFVLLIGWLTFSQYLFSINLGIDQLLIHDSSTAVGTSNPGRMAPLTAINFVLIGTALLLSSRQVQAYFNTIQTLVFVVGIIAFQAIIGYAYKVESFYGLSSFTQMALHTALTFLLLCVGVLCLYPHRGLVRILISPTLAGFLGRRLFFSAIAIPLCVGWLVVQGQQMGFYTAKLGISLLVMLSVVTLALLVWWSITALERIDAERIGTVQALQDSEASRRELAQVQEALQRSESIFRSYFELSLIGIAVISPEKGWIEVNTELCRILGYSEVELCQMTWVELTHPDDLQADLDCFNQVIAGQQEGYSLDKRFIRKDGAVVYASISTRCIRRPNGSVDYFVALVQDIGERVRNEAERQKAEAERVKLVQEQAARAEAEAANQMKDEFLAVLSHELRTPLNAVLGWTRLLRSRHFDGATTTQALETIERNAEVQAQLIDDILDVSRIIQGQLSLNLCPIDVRSVLEEAIASIRLTAEAKAIDIHLVQLNGKDAHSLNTVVLGDPKRLQQIFWNLLSNAIKFTDQGGRVDIHLELLEGEVRKEFQQEFRDSTMAQANQPSDGYEGEETMTSQLDEAWQSLHPPSSWQSATHATPQQSFVSQSLRQVTHSLSHFSHHCYVQVRVTDTGKGISPEFLPHVFDRFRQADSSTTRTHGGLGLGLAIVHHLVELHQGTIAVDSPGEGQGATFTVRLPLMPELQQMYEPQQEPDRPLGRISTFSILANQGTSQDADLSSALVSTSQISISPSPTSLNGLHILVVDDEADTRTVLKFVLMQAGAIVTVVASADSALDLLDKVEADILVSAIGMPSMDGYALIRAIRQRSANEGGTIGAIALTAYAQEEDSQKALQAGFQLYLTKPVKAEDLVQAIATLAYSSR